MPFKLLKKNILMQCSGHHLYPHQPSAPGHLLFTPCNCNKAIMNCQLNHMTNACLYRLITTPKSKKSSAQRERESVEY